LSSARRVDQLMANVLDVVRGTGFGSSRAERFPVR
jgi:hypothetical protein